MRTFLFKSRKLLAALSNPYNEIVKALFQSSSQTVPVYSFGYRLYTYDSKIYHNSPKSYSRISGTSFQLQPRH